MFKFYVGRKWDSNRQLTKKKNKEKKEISNRYRVILVKMQMY